MSVSHITNVNNDDYNIKFYNTAFNYIQFRYVDRVVWIRKNTQACQNLLKLMQF